MKIFKNAYLGAIGWTFQSIELIWGLCSHISCGWMSKELLSKWLTWNALIKCFMIM
jgi:hypothetical protein